MALLYTLLPSLGFLAGVMVGRVVNRPKPDLTRNERKELEQQRALMGDLITVLAEGSVLGDHSAVRALDLINKRSNR